MPSSNEILRSAFTRFLPGWISTLIAFPLIFAPRSFLELGRPQFEFLTLFSSAALAGHALVLALLRPRLRDDADLVGRKSVVAGACSVGGLLITSMLPHGLRGPTTIALTYMAVAGIVTAGLYVPWLQTAGTRQRPPIPRSSGLESSGAHHDPFADDR
jgi:hypothetical protein